MYKRLFNILILVFAVGSTAFAQIEIETDSFSTSGEDPSKFEIKILFNVLNNSQNPNDTSFYWKRVVLGGCAFENAVCDLNLCYPPSYDSAHFFMPIGLDTPFTLYFYPDNVSNGCCSLWIYLVSTLDDSNKDSAYFQTCTVASVFDPLYKELKLIPNPTTDHLSMNTGMKKPYTVYIYNASGQEVYVEEDVLDGQKIPTGELEPGTYYMKVIGETLFSSRFQKF